MDTIIENFVIKNLNEESPFEDAFAEINALPNFKKPPIPNRPALKLVYFIILRKKKETKELSKIVL